MPRRTRRETICKICGKRGHYSTECFESRASVRKKAEKHEEENLVYDVFDENFKFCDKNLTINGDAGSKCGLPKGHTGRCKKNPWLDEIEKKIPNVASTIKMAAYQTAGNREENSVIKNRSPRWNKSFISREDERKCKQNGSSNQREFIKKKEYSTYDECRWVCIELTLQTYGMESEDINLNQDGFFAKKMLSSEIKKYYSPISGIRFNIKQFFLPRNNLQHLEVGHLKPLCDEYISHRSGLVYWITRGENLIQSTSDFSDEEQVKIKISELTNIIENLSQLPKKLKPAKNREINQ